jgi:hypothetical protein
VQVLISLQQLEMHVQLVALYKVVIAMIVIKFQQEQMLLELLSQVQYVLTVQVHTMLWQTELASLVIIQHTTVKLVSKMEVDLLTVLLAIQDII